jgi:2-methylcitrate dehydratase PrpD
VVFKPYPCNHFTHAGVDAALRLRAKGLALADVTAIELGVEKPVPRTIAEPPEAKARPASGYHAAFSGPCTVAAALRRGRALQRVVPARLPRRPARDGRSVGAR